jgi:hypothetical protein
MDNLDRHAPPAGRGRRAASGAIARAGALLASLAVLGGCGTPGYVHIYSKAQDELAQSAKTNYGKANITEVLKAEVANQATLQGYEVTALKAYARSVRDLELHQFLGSEEPVGIGFVNGQIGVALRQLGIKPETPLTDLAPLLRAARAFRSALETIAAATKIIGAESSTPLTWCDRTFDVSTLPQDVKDVFEDYVQACSDLDTARADIERELERVELKPRVTLSVAKSPNDRAVRFVGSVPFDKEVRAALGSTPETIADCMRRRDMYIIADPGIDPDHPLIRVEDLTPTQQRALGLTPAAVDSPPSPTSGGPVVARKATVPRDVPPAMVIRPGIAYRDLADWRADLATLQGGRELPPTPSRAPAQPDPALRAQTDIAKSRLADVSAARPKDPRVTSSVDLEDCFNSIAPRRLTRAIKRLVDDEEDLVRRRAAVDAAKAAYDKAVRDLEASQGSDRKAVVDDAKKQTLAARDALQRLACLLLPPPEKKTADDKAAEAKGETKAADAAGVGKVLPTLTEALGFKTDSCDLTPKLAADGWLPALAQQYLAEVATSILTKRLADSGKKDLKLPKCPTATAADADAPKPDAGGGQKDPEGDKRKAERQKETEIATLKVCEAAKAFDTLARKIMQQERQEEDLKLAEITVKKQYYQVLLDQARKAVSRTETVIALRNTQVLAATDELEYLRRALHDLNFENANVPETACPDPTLNVCRTASGVLLTAGPDKLWQVALARSVSHYLDSVTIGRIQYEVADLQIKNVSHLRAVDDSQFALLAYDALISSPLTLLANYHATGITASDVAQLLQVLAIAGIAVK